MSRIPRLIVTRGLPGCGKTTRARQWVAEDPRTRCRVNRDDYRIMFHRAVSVVQLPTIRALLTEGLDVISDDAWLRPDLFAEIVDLAQETGVEFEVWDMRNVLPDICIERDMARGSLVGADAIIDMYARYIAS